MNSETLHPSYIKGMRIDETFGRFRISCKVGSYCEFGFDQISNQRHQHDCYELCVVIDGTGRFFYEDATHFIKKGDILIANPGIQHEIQADPAENLLLLYIFIEIKSNSRIIEDKSFPDQCIDKFLKSHLPKASPEHLLAYLSFIENYNSSREKFHFGTYEAIKNLILESLQFLSNQNENIDNSATNAIKNVIEESLDYIDTNLHRKIIVEEVASNCCTSRRNLEYIFRKQLDKTVIGYINEKKIELACHYLCMYFNISDTANMVGITNPSQFSVLFKKYKGLSPKQYQKEHVNDGKGMGRRL